jgi:hypothetical protein
VSSHGTEGGLIMRASHKTTNTPHLTHTLRHHNPHGGSSQPDGCNTRRHGGEDERRSQQPAPIHPSPRQQRLTRPSSVQPHQHGGNEWTSGRHRPCGAIIVLFHVPTPKGQGGAGSTVIRCDKLRSNTTVVINVLRTLGFSAMLLL